MKKTCKIITKRVKIKPKSAKVIRKKSCQSHYNSNDTGSMRRDKRKPKFLNKKSVRKIIKLTS